MKRCFKCGATKPPSEFYKHPMMADGRLGKCKECTRVDVRSNRRARLGHYRSYDRERWEKQPARRARARAYGKTARGRAVVRRARALWAERNRHKRRAHFAVNNAIRDGRLSRRPCERCGRRAQAHHDDYSKPLDVRWLCVRHHVEHHKAERERNRETNQ